jgi:hypothetical protein
MIRETAIPDWAMTILVGWAERAYRRGYQHGLVTYADGAPYDVKIADWRFARIRLDGRDGTPFDPCELTIERRHTTVDVPRDGLDARLYQTACGRAWRLSAIRKAATGLTDVETEIPPWAMTLLIKWVERAYRRGVQQGMCAADKQGATNDPKVGEWRSAAFKLGERARTPHGYGGGVSIRSRHIDVDSPAIAVQGHRPRGVSSQDIRLERDGQDWRMTVLTERVDWRGYNDLRPTQ